MNARRNFFSYLAGSVLATVDELRGIPQLRLSDLETLPDENLARLIPSVDYSKILLRETEGEIYRKDADAVAKPAICRLDAVEQTVFLRFSGTETIADIAAWAADTHKISSEESFKATRRLFLRLSQLRVCHPVNMV